MTIIDEARSKFHSGRVSGASLRAELGIGNPVTISIPKDVLDRQLKRNAFSHSDPTALLMGDPHPGESALDHMAAPPVAPMQPTSRRHGNSFGPPIRSPRELRRMKAMSTHTKGEG